MSTPSYSPSESPFLDRVRRTIRLNHLSRRTEKSYFYYILDERAFRIDRTLSAIGCMKA
ncbi:hypothetical protein QUB68_27215 [Microcoleus sp. A006_D1]|uniref:hypothetical protein n=1 Tax=Microcoleus sp. A006_D1 TaxID=3055267 RepID=UPI002FD23DC7